VPFDYFAGRIATEYEERWPELFAPSAIEPVVRFLTDRAGAGPALELGIGTGRLALPLRESGIDVHGIELSADMVAQLRAAPGGDAIGVTMGDFSTVAVDGGSGTFALAYLVRNTIMNLTSQDEQVACFRNVAAHLRPGGRFVVEVLVPALRRLPPGDTVRPSSLTPTHLVFDEYEVVSQGLVSHHFWMRETGVETFSAPFRYVWPSELDLMARLAGMTLRERYEDWTGTPFASESENHISVWEKTSGSDALA
jgi:SAM-dependent methyltransferase